MPGKEGKVMLQAWGLVHFSSKNDRRHGIFHEACSARLASDPDGTEIEAEDMLCKHSWARSRSRQDIVTLLWKQCSVTPAALYMMSRGACGLTRFVAGDEVVGLLEDVAGSFAAVLRAKP